MKSVFKTLTFILCTIVLSQDIFAQAIKQDALKTHLRWNIISKKEQVKISKKGNTVKIQSLDPDFFESFSSNVSKLPSQSDYIKSMKFKRPETPGAPYSLDINLKDESVELFSFYKQENSNYILDFWINQDVVRTKKASIKKPKKKIKVAKLNKPKKVKTKKVVKKEAVGKALKAKTGSRFSVIDPSNVSENKEYNQFRDFRYGASFVWDYKAFVPPIEQDVNLKSKAPDYFYEIKDVDNLDDKKLAHLQLSINFYRKAEWGLMTRSINLYEEKYGRDENKVLNDYMKSLSMIKNSIKESLKPEYKSSIDENGDIVPGKEYSKRGIMAAARSLLKSVVESSTDYELSKSVLRYLIQFSRDEKDYIQALEYSKKLYVESSENFDNDMIIYSSRVILNSLANLRQLDKIKSFLGNKVVIRVLPKQVGDAYISFIHLENDNAEMLTHMYEKNKRSYSNPVHPAILFNTAEAYFRLGNYKNAVKLFDKFISENSMFSQTAQARLRIALSYDLLDKPHKVVLRLYEDAINKSSDMAIRFEAKLRYVGLRVNRVVKPTEEDFETISFLDASRSEKPLIKTNLQKLLWLVRLRSFISQRKYDDALAYLSTIPLDSIRLIDKRVFNGDGAEIVLGIIKDAYLDNDYAKAVKVWEVYKDKYESKVANNPYMNFIVSDSFLKLGLSRSFERSMKYLEGLKDAPTRKFPLWVKPHKNIAVEDYIVELKLNKDLRDNNYKGLSSYLEQNKKNKNINYKFYNGLVAYQLKNYNKAVTSFESLLVNPNINNILTPRQNLKMIETYLESLYEVAKPERFRKNVAALVNDLRLSANKKYQRLVERADYLYLESLFSERDVKHKLLGMKSKEFISAYKQSTYLDRVNYLRGVALVNSQAIEEGRKILNELLSGKDVPEYLKGLVRSELSTLELRSKTL